MLENAERGVSRVSTVIFPGQSHISSGMRVLAKHVCGSARDARRDDLLERVLGDTHCGFEVERLLRGQVLEQNLQYGCFTTPAGVIFL